MWRARSALAFLINASILILAAAAFHQTGATDVADIEDAYRLLEPIAGTAMASLLFGIALLASGQSSTFTGTIAGQVIMEGFLDLKIPCYQRRLITRGLAIIPALIGVLWMGEHAVGKLLVLTQVVLSAQLPFAIYPLIRFTSSKAMMGPFASKLAHATSCLAALCHHRRRQSVADDSDLRRLTFRLSPADATPGARVLPCSKSEPPTPGNFPPDNGFFRS